MEQLEKILYFDIQVPSSKGNFEFKNIPLRIQKTNNVLPWTINCEYGFNFKFQNCEAKEHGKVEKYRLASSITPRKNTILIEKKSGRVFTVGEFSGFIHYKAPIFENGKIVANICFEDYYKD